MSAVIAETGVVQQDQPVDARTLERTLARGFAWLSFPAELEQRFQQACEAKRYLMILAAGLGGMLLFAAMLVADFLQTPEVLSAAVVWRCAVYPPVVVIGLVVARRVRSPALTEWLVTLGGVVAGGIEAVILMSVDQPWALVRVAELNLLVVYICAIARFWPAVVSVLCIGLIHTFLVISLPDVGNAVVLNTSLLLGIASIFLLYGNYKLEHDERAAFLMAAREQALHAELLASHERVRQMATTDALTQVANRRYAEGYMKECWERALAQRRYLSVLVLDVDDFKRFNDGHGHQAGDRCLVAVAQAIKRSIRRPSDLLARWGGEEFLVVMMDADADAAAAAAERIRSAVQALALPHRASACAQVVTVSGGRATMVPNASATMAHLIELADAALYQAKRGGRNRVRAGHELPTQPEAA